MSHYYYQSTQPVYRSIHPQMQNQSSGNPVPKLSMTDRPMRESFILNNNYQNGLTSSMHRDNSLKYLTDLYSNKGDQMKIVTLPQNGQSIHHRTFSDYQLGLSGVKPETANNKQTINNETSNAHRTNGALNSMSGSKIVSRQRNSGSANKLTQLNLESNLGKIRQTDSFICVQKNEAKQMKEINCEYLNNEFAKLSQRMMRNELKIAKLQKNAEKKPEDSLTASTQSSTYNTLQELKQLIGLVEETKGYQTKTREEYRKMNDECRATILEFKQQLNKLPKRKDLEELQEQFSTRLKFQEDKIQKEISVVKSKLQAQIAETIKSFHEISEKVSISLSNKTVQSLDDSRKHITSGIKQFEGKMVSFVYEQKIILQNLNNSGKITGFTHKVGNTSTEKEKQNSNSVLVSSKTYYLDTQGYLLDKNKYYLLDGNGEQIKLTEKQIDLLRKNSILS